MGLGRVPHPANRIRLYTTHIGSLAHFVPRIDRPPHHALELVKRGEAAAFASPNVIRCRSTIMRRDQRDVAESAAAAAAALYIRLQIAKAVYLLSRRKGLRYVARLLQVDGQ